MAKPNSPQEEILRQRLKKKKKKRGLLIALLVILGIVVLLTVSVLVMFLHYFNRSNYVSDDDITDTTTQMADETVPVSNTEETEEESTEEVATVASEVEDELIEQNQLTVEEIEKGALDKIYNLLLVGVDRRNKSWNGNSDAMILITINKNTNKLYMTSFMRDLYANIAGVGVRKLNHAYAVGAGPLLVETLQTNYGVAIDNYASVDFEDMKHIIDILGGVDIEIKDYELSEMAEVGIYNTGMQHLTGAQALKYSRIRYHGNADFERTQRQRVVINCLIEKARNMRVLELASFADQVLPYVTHNMSARETLNLMTDLPTIIDYEVVEQRIPYDGEYYSQNEILIPKDINDTVTKLRSVIYAAE